MGIANLRQWTSYIYMERMGRLWEVKSYNLWYRDEWMNDPFGLLCGHIVSSHFYPLPCFRSLNERYIHCSAPVHTKNCFWLRYRCAVLSAHLATRVEAEGIYQMRDKSEEKANNSMNAKGIEETALLSIRYSICQTPAEIDLVNFCHHCRRDICPQ